MQTNFIILASRKNSFLSNRCPTKTAVGTLRLGSLEQRHFAAHGNAVLCP